MPVNRGRRSPLFWALIGLLALEFVLAAIIVLVLLVELLVDRPTSYASAVALTVISAVGPVWLGAVIVGALRGRAWIRGAALVWQFLQLAIGVGALQGATAQPAMGWPLVAASAVGILLLLSRPVAAETADRESRAPDPEPGRPSAGR